MKKIVIIMAGISFGVVLSGCGNISNELEMEHTQYVTESSESVLEKNDEFEVYLNDDLDNVLVEETTESVFESSVEESAEGTEGVVGETVGVELMEMEIAIEAESLIVQEESIVESTVVSEMESTSSGEDAHMVDTMKTTMEQVTAADTKPVETFKEPTHSVQSEQPTPAPVETPAPEPETPSQTMETTQASEQVNEESVEEHTHSFAWHWLLKEPLGGCLYHYADVDICAQCGYILNTNMDYGNVNIHSSGEPVYVSKAETCGEVEEYYEYCTICGEECSHIKFTKNHFYNECSFCDDVEKSTCVTPGKGHKKYMCIYCGDTYVDENVSEGKLNTLFHANIDRRPDDIELKEVINEPDCIYPGTAVYECKYCHDYTFMMNYGKEPLGYHEWDQELLQQSDIYYCINCHKDGDELYPD